MVAFQQLQEQGHLAGPSGWSCAPAAPSCFDRASFTCAQQGSSAPCGLPPPHLPPSSLYMTHRTPDGTRTSGCCPGNRPSPQCTAWLFLSPTLSFPGKHQPSLPTKQGAHPPRDGQHPRCTHLPVHTPGVAQTRVGWASLPSGHVGAVQRPWGNSAPSLGRFPPGGSISPCCSLLCGV